MGMLKPNFFNQSGICWNIYCCWPRNTPCSYYSHWSNLRLLLRNIQSILEYIVEHIHHSRKFAATSTLLGWKCILKNKAQFFKICCPYQVYIYSINSITPIYWFIKSYPMSALHFGWFYSEYFGPTYMCRTYNMSSYHIRYVYSIKFAFVLYSSI